MLHHACSGSASASSYIVKTNIHKDPAFTSAEWLVQRTKLTRRVPHVRQHGSALRRQQQAATQKQEPRAGGDHNPLLVASRTQDLSCRFFALSFRSFTCDAGLQKRTEFVLVLQFSKLGHLPVEVLCRSQLFVVLISGAGRGRRRWE